MKSIDISFFARQTNEGKKTSKEILNTDQGHFSSKLNLEHGPLRIHAKPYIQHHTQSKAVVTCQLYILGQMSSYHHRTECYHHTVLCVYTRHSAECVAFRGNIQLNAESALLITAQNVTTMVFCMYCLMHFCLFHSFSNTQVCHHLVCCKTVYNSNGSVQP